MLTAFTLFHVVLSLIGIGAGFVFVRDLLLSRIRSVWTNLYLYSTIATSATGFLFPADHITPAHILGLVSLAVLALAVRARGKADWRRTYVVTTILALYLNVFVLVVQLFLKVPPLHALAPTQTELPFQLAQGAVLLLFCAVGFRALKAQSSTVAAIA
ncbi:MAG: hypothetical protein K2X03_23580 [Bryobacteraceae bacterium]|nr:hypothetical protein [Bryobacteraceae bacterium]